MVKLHGLLFCKTRALYHFTNVHGGKQSAFCLAVSKRAESVYAECGLTFRFERAVARLMSEIDAGDPSAASRGWIDESDIAKEFGGST